MVRRTCGGTPGLPTSASPASCVAYKVPVAVALARQALQEGKCVVVGLQSTGEARVKQMARDKGMQVGGMAWQWSRCR